MSRYFHLIFLLIFLECVVVGSVSAHVPLSTDETTGLNLVFIPEPTKSWVIYDRIEGPCDAKYYVLDLMEGEELRVSVFVTEKTILPGLIVSGPDIEKKGYIPDCLRVNYPENAELVVLKTPEKPDYEPFTPQAIYQTGGYSKIIETPGLYYITIYGTDTKGKVGTAIGYIEKFTIYEWVMIPLLTTGIHVWEGQPIPIIILPFLITVALGFIFIGRLWAVLLPWNKFALFASFFYMGGAAMVALQMIIALIKTGLEISAFLTIFFISVQFLLGILLLWVGRSTKKPTYKTAAILLITGMFGFFIWAGLVIGPVISIMGGIFALYEILKPENGDDVF